MGQTHGTGVFGGDPLTPDGARLAERSSRVGAWLVDAVCVTVVAGVLNVVISVSTGMRVWSPMGGSWPEFDLRDWIGGVVTLATYVVWQWVFLDRGGRTPGKILVGLRVRPYAVDGPLSHGMIARRIAVGATFFATGAVPFVGFLLGFLGVGDGLAMLTDPRRQALHDRAADTCVVVSRRSAPRSRPTG